MRRPRSGGSLRRRGPVREPLPVILVVCEGEVTEPDYVDGFRRAYGANTVRVKVVAPGGDPVGLVERAVQLRAEADDRAERERDENRRYDEVWCVFDVDEHARLRQARDRAAEAGIRLAVSNPCFELWLLLHFVEHSAVMPARRLVERLRRHLPTYRKKVRFLDCSEGYADAVTRAAGLDARHARDGRDGANPSTGVYRLTERIRELGREYRLRGAGASPR
jgi:hypothetical protein